MRTIKSRLNCILILVILSATSGSALIWRKYNAIVELQNHLEGNLALRSEILTLISADYSLSNKTKVFELRDNFLNTPLARVMNDLASTYSSQNRFALSQRVKQFNDASHQDFIKTQSRITRLNETLFHDALFTFLVPVFGLLFFMSYMRRKVFEPQLALSHKMLDFLTDRYSFKFSIPENNEIGDMQRTFNSLAQRVLNNFDELKALDIAKSEFLSIASHELRTPMTSIKGSLSLLKSGVIGPLDLTSKKLVMIAEKETDRLIRLINDLLDLTKIEARSLQLSKQWIDVDLFLEKTLEGVLGFAQTAKVKLHLKEMAQSVEIYCDPDRLQQVVTNLASNAIKFSPSGGKVTVGFDVTRASELIIEVTDEGEGISEEMQSHIFEKFSQATTKDNPIVKGTGLGLAIAKALIEEHGGSIGVKSNPGKGSTFFIVLHEWRKSEISLQSEKRGMAA